MIFFAGQPFLKYTMKSEMRMKTTSILLLLSFLYFQPAGLIAQATTPQQYVDTYKDLAIREMRRMGVPAAIKLAQGILETESGNSPLLKKSNNHFGIKCKSSWSGNGVSHDDDAPGECFRVYGNAEESYRDHSNFLRGSERYSFLFELDPSDYRGWAYGLKKAGYATNPRYPEILIRNIEQYGLQQYSLAAAADVPRFDRSSFEDDAPVPVAGDPAVTSVETAFNPALAERINGLRALVAPAGTSLLAIASAQDIPLDRLLAYNDLRKDGLLDREMIIYLEGKPKSGKLSFCSSAYGETLHSLSQQYAVQLSAIRQYNAGLGEGVLDPGTRVWLQQPAGEQRATASGDQKQAAQHTVQPREGLYSIARKYGVSQQQLKEWNQLANDSLRIGQSLIVVPPKGN
jgi:LysM repeat protein